MSSGLIFKYKWVCRSGSLTAAIAAVLRWLVNRRKELISLDDQIQKQHLKLSAMLNESFSASVCYGSFKGLQLSLKIIWGKADCASMYRFSKSVVIVELYYHFFAGGTPRLAHLRSKAERVFDIEELTTTSGNLSGFSAVKAFSDTDRWLICSDGRRAMPHWYVMTPREGS
jgi:hypothetical protein